MLRSLISILHANLVQFDTEMAEKYAEQQHPAVCGKFGIGWYAAGCVSALHGPSDFDLWHFDLETGMLVTPKVGKLHSEFGHARPCGSRVIRYVRDGRTDRQ